MPAMTGDRAIRGLTAAVVLAVAAFAAVVSYSHIYDLARRYGQAGTAARILPLSVDGVIIAAGLVMLLAARNDGPDGLARLMLWLGIAATVGANVAYGLGYGALGAVISAWPAVAFIGSAEMALGMVRAARTRTVPGVSPQVTDPASEALSEAAPEALPGVYPAVSGAGTAYPGNGHGAPEGGPEAARMFAAELARGEVPGIRRIRSECGVGQPRAQEIRGYLETLARQPAGTAAGS